MTETIDNEALLKTLSENPEAAHFLADLTAGGNLYDLIEAHFGIKPSTLNDDASDTPTEDAEETDAHDEPPANAPSTEEPTVGMYQSQVATDSAPSDSTPSFLSNLRPDFWGDMVIF
jgi:hypothetical protein